MSISIGYCNISFIELLASCDAYLLDVVLLDMCVTSKCVTLRMHLCINKVVPPRRYCWLRSPNCLMPYWLRMQQEQLSIVLNPLAFETVTIISLRWPCLRNSSITIWCCQRSTYENRKYTIYIWQYVNSASFMWALFVFETHQLQVVENLLMTSTI